MFDSLLQSSGREKNYFCVMFRLIIATYKEVQYGGKCIFWKVHFDCESSPLKVMSCVCLFVNKMNIIQEACIQTGFQTERLLENPPPQETLPPSS